MNHSRLFYMHNCCLLSSGIFASYNSLCFLSRHVGLDVEKHDSSLPQRKQQGKTSSSNKLTRLTCATGSGDPMCDPSVLISLKMNVNGNDNICALFSFSFLHP